MKIDHTITKGYPYDVIISQERFKKRPNIILDRKDNNKIKLWMNQGEFPEYKPATWLQRQVAGKAIDFLEFRLFDYAEALLVAENQIEHMLQEDPFIPEDFGFIKVVGPKDITDNPTKIYTSKYDETISLFRNMAEDYEWHLIKNNSGAFHDTRLLIPNHRIAYALFFGLGIKVEEPKEQEEEKSSVLKDFTAIYSGSDIRALSETPEGSAACITLKAYDEDDARNKAQFIFASSNFGLKKVIPENLTIINK